MFNIPLRNQWKLQHQIKHFHWFPYVMLIKTFPDRCQVATFNWFQLFFEDELFFLDRSFLKRPRSQSDSFIFRVFYDRSNCAKLLLEICIAVLFVGHTSTRMEYQFREAVHVPPPPHPSGNPPHFPAPPQSGTHSRRGAIFSVCWFS